MSDASQERIASPSRGQRLNRYRAARRRLSPRTSRVAFERLVAQAVDELPDFARERMENVAVLVEERPEPARLAALGHDPRQGLLGLYEGIPRPQRGSGYHLVVPDRITIFRQPILGQVGQGGDAEIVREVQRTVIHEVAHHFGLSDEELAQLEGRR